MTLLLFFLTFRLADRRVFCLKIRLAGSIDKLGKAVGGVVAEVKNIYINSKKVEIVPLRRICSSLAD